MRRVWLADDVYNALQVKESSINFILREILRLPHRSYSYRPKKKKSEAVRKGIAKAKRRGVIIGRPRVPEYAREEIRKTRKQSGWSPTSLALCFGVSVSTVKRIPREE